MLIKNCPVCGVKNRIVEHNATVRPICGRCRSKLFSDLHSSSSINMRCVICGSTRYSTESLSNGEVYHKECFLGLSKNIELIDSEISKSRSEIRELEMQLKEANKVGHFIKSLFTGKTINVSDVNAQIADKENAIRNLSARKMPLKESISKIYAFWLTYPPDWNERCSAVRGAGYCAECGSSSRKVQIHVHHRVPISRGGSHALDNLIRLCEKCHAKAHGGQQFSYSYSSQIGAFGMRLKLVQDAIQNNALIRFHYRRRDGQRSVRSIRPEGLKHEGDLLCVYGHCYLRGVNRTFAIKRMDRAILVGELGECYEVRG
jgi:ribosomal protein S27AE